MLGKRLLLSLIVLGSLLISANLLAHQCVNFKMKVENNIIDPQRQLGEVSIEFEQQDELTGAILGEIQTTDGFVTILNHTLSFNNVGVLYTLGDQATVIELIDECSVRIHETANFAFGTGKFQSVTSGFAEGIGVINFCQAQINFQLQGTLCFADASVMPLIDDDGDDDDDDDDDDDE